jgi:hypothetical protein
MHQNCLELWKRCACLCLIIEQHLALKGVLFAMIDTLQWAADVQELFKHQINYRVFQTTTTMRNDIHEVLLWNKCTNFIHIHEKVIEALWKYNSKTLVMG